MERLKQILELGKQHYEKLILSLALLVLAVAAWVFYQKGQATKTLLEEWEQGNSTGRPKVMDPLDLSTNEMVINAMTNLQKLDLSAPHNLVNPVKWQRRPDGSLIKIATGNEVGAAQLEVTGMTPLNYRIVMNQFSPGPDGQPAVFTFTTLDETITFNPRRPYPKRFFLNTTDRRKDEIANLVAVRGEPDNPEVVLQLADTQTEIAISKDNPYQEVRGYLADLNYKVENRKFENTREGLELEFGGEKYKIIAIKQNEVVLSGLLNNKNYTIPYSASVGRE